MTKFVALLRGINVGGNHKLEMKKLALLFESLGFTGVKTYINSGNVLFETDKKDLQKLCFEIEEILGKTFKFKIGVLLREKENIRNLCKQIPKAWENNEEQRTDVLFLWPEFDSKDSLELVTKTPSVDTLKYFPGALVWNIKRAEYNKSAMRKFIGTKLYKNTTIRNINTLRKLNELLG
jgi:uncharacterized protein (DUF1697 family)